MAPTVNEVSDDKSVILNLKKELHEARLALKDLKETQAQIIIQAPPEIKTITDFTSTMDEFPFLDKFLSTMAIDGEDIFFQTEEAPDENQELNPPEGEADGEAEEGDDAAEGEEETEEDVERFRQEILAKFMADMEDGGSANSEDRDQEVEENISVVDSGDHEVGEIVTEPDVKGLAEVNIVAESYGQQEEEKKSIHEDEEVHDNHALHLSEEIEENTSKHDDDEESTDLDLFHDPDPDVSVVDTKILGIYDRIVSIHEMPKTEDELINSFRHDLLFKMQEIMEVSRSETGGAQSADGLSRTDLIALADELADRIKLEINEKLRGMDKGVGENYLGAPEQNNLRIPHTLANVDAQLPSDDDSSLSSGPGAEVEKFENEIEENVLDGATYETFESEPSPRSRPRNMSMVPVVDGRHEFPILPTPARSRNRLLSMIPTVDGKIIGSVGIERDSGARERSPMNAISSVGGTNANEEIQSDISSENEQSKENDPAIINWKNSIVPDNEGVSKKGVKPPVTKDSNKNAGEMTHKELDEIEERTKALSERIDTTDRLVEALFVELENARSFVREIVFEGTDAENHANQPSSSYLGGSGVVVVDEFLMRQCGVLKFSIYLSLAFYVFGQHELFLASVFFIWLSLEVVTKV